jgi:single-strand DNA-binding protein
MAESINRVNITGNLTRDAELRETKGGEVLTVSVAVNERRRNADGDWEDAPSYILCKMFGKRARGIQPYLPKGTKVALEGHLRSNTWETKEGERRSSLDVIIDRLDFMAKMQREAPKASSPEAAPQVDSDVYEEEIPF